MTISNPRFQTPIKNQRLTSCQSPLPIAKWDVVSTPRGSIKVNPPARIKKELIERGIRGNVIYRWKHKVTGRRYYGSALETESGNTVFKRFSHYEQKLKEGKKRTHIENAIHRSPSKFTGAIVEHLPDSDENDLLVAEEKWQDRFDTRTRLNGYNHSRPTQEQLRSKNGKIIQKRRLAKPRTRHVPLRKSAQVALEKIFQQSFD